MATLFDNSVSGGNWTFFDNTRLLAQGLAPTVDYAAVQIRISIRKVVDFQGVVTVTIQTDVDNLPSGVILATGSFDIDPFPVDPLTAFWIPFALDTNPVLSPGTLYWIVMQGGNAANTDWRYDNDGDPYPGGYAISSPDSGATWFIDTKDDRTFEVYGNGIAGGGFDGSVFGPLGVTPDPCGGR